MYRVLITGGAGFIGSTTLEYLFHKYPDYHFVILDILTYAGDMKNIPDAIKLSPRFEFWYGDIRNAALVDRLVAKVDVVIHFAAESHVARSLHDDTIFFETDVIGTQRIARAVLNHKDTIRRFIHISTSEVYGTALTETMDEEHPLNPQSPYAAAKAGADRLLASYISSYAIPAVIVRPFNIFGPRQHLEKLFPRFITGVLLDEHLTIHGTGKSMRDFTYVLDLSRALDCILHADSALVHGEIFNVGTGTSLSIQDVARLILERMVPDQNGGKYRQVNVGSYAVNISDRPGQVFRHTANASKIQSVLGWKPQVSLHDGVDQTIAWYKDNRSWWSDKLWMRHVPVITEDGKVESH